VEIRRVWGKKSSSSSSSKKELLGSTSGKCGPCWCFPRARVRRLRDSGLANGAGVGWRAGTSAGTNEREGEGEAESDLPVVVDCGARRDVACDLTLRRKEKGERRVVVLSSDEGGASRLGWRGRMLLRATCAPMSSKEAVTMALNSAMSRASP
jgi:hypothetical protein